MAEAYDQILKDTLSPTGEDKSYFAEHRVAYLTRMPQLRDLKAPAILDYGCGTGGAVNPLLHHFPGSRVDGVDPSELSLAVGRKLQDGNPRVAFYKLEQLSADGSYDLAHCNGVFHHIPAAHRSEAMRYIWSRLAPGAWFAFFENNAWNPATLYLMSRCEFDKDAEVISPRSAVRLLKDHGFTIDCVRSLFYFPRSLAALRTLEPALAYLPFGGQYLVLARKPV